jgi:hypothetical protein
MMDSPPSQPAHKVSMLASVFVNVATVYIESKEQEVRNSHASPQKPTVLAYQNYMNDDIYQQAKTTEWAPMDPFLHALGFAENPSLSIGAASSANANLENWFNGNQHIMGLLEDDLSYLDDAIMTFETT